MTSTIPPSPPTRQSVIASRVNPDHRSASIAFAAWLSANGLKGHSQLVAPSSPSSSSSPAAPRALGFGIKQGASNEWQLIATQPIASGQPILTLPLDLTIPINAPQHPPSSTARPSLAFAPLDAVLRHVPDTLWQLQLGLRLLSERTKALSSASAASFFQPYIDLLPLSFPTVPLFFQRDDLLALQYPPIVQQVVKRSKLLLSLTSIIRQLQIESPQQDPFFGQHVDVNALGWAMTAVSSRAFSFHQHRRLLPLIDMANHSFAPSAHLSSDEFTLTLTATRALEAGEELTLNYGARSNDDFLINFGFVHDDNPHDDILLKWDPATVQLALDLTAAPPAPSSAPLLPWQSALLAQLPNHDLVMTRDGLDPRIHALWILLLTPSSHPVIASLTPEHPYLTLAHQHDPELLQRVRRAESVFLGLVAGAWGGGKGIGAGMESDLKELVEAAESGREERVVALRYRVGKKRLLREHLNRVERSMATK